MKKILFIVSLLCLTLMLNNAFLVSKANAQIIGRSAIYGEIEKVDLNNSTLIVNVGNSQRSFNISTETKLEGYKSLNEINIGDSIELVIETTFEGDEKLLILKPLNAKLDFSDHPDIDEKMHHDDIKKIWQEIEKIKERLKKLEK